MNIDNEQPVVAYHNPRAKWIFFAVSVACLISGAVGYFVTNRPEALIFCGAGVIFSIGFFVLGKKSGVVFSFDSYGYLRFNKDGVEHCVKADEIEKVKFWPMTMASIEFEIYFKDQSRERVLISAFIKDAQKIKVQVVEFFEKHAIEIKYMYNSHT